MFPALFSMLSPPGERARLSILIFHRVAPKRDELYPGEVTQQEFDRICGYLREWFNVLPLGEAARRLTEGTLPSRALSITFDDGYADNHDVALPLLQRHRLPATFFVATGFLDGGRMWNDSVVESVRRCAFPALDLRGTVASALGVLPLGSSAERRAAIDKVLGATKYLPMAARDDWVAAISERSGAELPDDLMMTAEQVRALHCAGMTIGAHTVHHPILSRLDRGAAATEIDEGRRALQAITGAPVRLFAYPNGKPVDDYGPEAVAIVKDLGFDAAVSTSWRAAHRGDDVHQLPRFTPWDRTRWRFGLRMARTLAAA